jgi:hypothetical protein
VSAAKVAADYYVQCLTQEGREPTYKELAKAAERSDSWGAQQLRALRKAQEWTPEDDAAAKAAAEVEAYEGTEVPEADSRPAEAHTEAPATPVGTVPIVWGALLLGLGASVAANVVAVGGGTGQRIAAAFAPMALLLAVEILTRFRKAKRGGWLLYLGTGIIAAVTAVVSYGHTRSLLLHYGESNLAATILPLAPDGLILVSCVALMTMTKEEK